MQKLSLLLLLVVFISCKNKKAGHSEVKETRTSGTLDILVDETFAPIVQDQIDVFNLDYPDAHINQKLGNETKILPTFLNDTTRVMVLSRVLTPEEEQYYTKRSIRVNVSRFAIDGIALITNKDNNDSTITVKEVLDIFKGNSATRSLVFDNAYSSTMRYFLELAKTKELPARGV